MSIPEYDGQIKLGPGNEITDPQLIKLLNDQPPLKLDELLQASQFLQKYPGNAPLGQHLALVGLAMERGPKVVHAALAGYDDFEEGAEYAIRGSNDDPRNEPDPFDVFIRRQPVKGSILGLPIDGLALLVETFISLNEDNTPDIEKHFIIGVIPG